MAEPTRYTTPDGQFTLLVEPAADAIGFEDFPWHTHGDLLSRGNIFPGVSSVQEFLKALFADRLVIAVSRIGGTVQNVCISDDPDSEKAYVRDGETLELRYWSGRPYHAG